MSTSPSEDLPDHTGHLPIPKAWGHIDTYVMADPRAVSADPKVRA